MGLEVALSLSRALLNRKARNKKNITFGTKMLKSHILTLKYKRVNWLVISLHRKKLNTS